MLYTPILPANAPLSALPLILGTMDRQALETLAAAAIARLDEIDGDPDLEPNGDELDGSLAEDDFYVANVPHHLAGPGCPIADPAGADHDLHEGQDHGVTFPTWPVDQRRKPMEPDYSAHVRLVRPHIERVRRAHCVALRFPDAMGRTHRFAD